jgi:transcription elongation factor
MLGLRVLLRGLRVTRGESKNWLVDHDNQAYIFQNNTYKDGFIETDFKLSAIVTENVNPTLDEII